MKPIGAEQKDIEVNRQSPDQYLFHGIHIATQRDWLADINSPLYMETSLEKTMANSHADVRNIIDEDISDKSFKVSHDAVLQRMKNRIERLKENFKEQQNFLLELGIKERLKSLTKNVSSTIAERVESEVKRLIDPDKMGSLFKVIAITKTKRYLEGLNSYG